MTIERTPERPIQSRRPASTRVTPDVGAARTTLFIDPPSYHFERDRLFDLRTHQFGGDDLLAPYIHLRKRLNEHGIKVHTADLLERGEGLSERNVYISLGMRERPGAFAQREDVVVNALLAMECPVVEPQLYTELPAVGRHFKRILSYSTTEALVPYTKTPVEVEQFRLPQSFDSVHDQLWSQRNRRFLTMINGNKAPRLGLGELYTERLRAIEFFERTGEIDLYGVGWNGPPYRVGTRLPAALQRLVRAADLARHRLRPDPMIAAAGRAWRGRVRDKAATLSGYEFAICFENMKLSGWVTEKLFDCLFVGTVPVYLGAPDIADWIPRECFIDMREFAGYEELRSYLRSLSDRALQSYRDAGRDFIGSNAYRPFSKDAFLELFERLLEPDA